MKRLTIREETARMMKMMGLLTEGDSRLKKAENIIRNAFKGILNVDGLVPSSEYYVNGNPNTTWGQYLMFNLRHTFGLMTNSDVKYIPVVAQLAYSNEVKFDMTNDNGQEVALLSKFVELFKENEGIFNKVKSMPNLTFSAVKELLLPVIQQADKEANERMDVTDYGGLRTDYKIIEDADFETAERIGAMSCPYSRLCYTEKGNEMWESTTQDGKNKCYILLKDGYENIEARHSEPIYDFLPWDAYDEYGLSMIFVFVTPENDIYTANTRWNHSANYGKYSVDHAFDKESLSKIIGQSFNSLFKGYTKEELKKKGFKYIKFDEVQGLLDKGEKPEDIFDLVGSFNNGFAAVILNDKYNFIDANGNLLWKGEWFDNTGYFNKDGIAAVILNGKVNFIGTNGKILWNGEWFDEVGHFENGFARVYLKNKYNLIDLNGNLLWKGKEWFDWIGDFKDGFAKVQLNGKWNFIDIEGNLLWKGNEWFDGIEYFKDGFAKVQLNGKWNFIDTDGNLLWKGEWFDGIGQFKYGFVRVYLNRKWNFIDTKGNLLLKGDEWFDNAYFLNHDFAMVRRNDKFNFIDREGNLLWKGKWFDAVNSFYDGFALVLQNNKFNFIDTNGNLLWKGKEWLDGANDFKNGFAAVILNGKVNFLGTDGKLHDVNESRNRKIKNIIREEIYNTL